MKKIGIFLAFAPEQPIKNQGLGRLLCFVASAASHFTEIVVASPKWYEKEILEIFSDNNITSNNYELLLTPKEPYLLRIRNYIKVWIKKKINRTILKNTLHKKSKRFIAVLISGLAASSLLLFMGTLSLIFFISIATCLMYLLLLPFSFLQKYLLRHVQSLKRNSAWLSLPLKYLKNSPIAQQLYEEIYKKELKKLIKLVNARKDIKVWFIPTLFWPEIKNIKAKKIVTAPDVVFFDFPSQFATEYFLRAYDKICTAIQAADHLICYSDYVKHQHIIRQFNIEPDKISVIQHGSVDLSGYLLQINSAQSMTVNAKKILKKYLKENFNNDVYLKDFDISETKFIFYSSQFRPHKNLLNLIKAYEKLLRERHVGVKLIVTAHLQSDKDIADFIKANRLQYDVLSFFNIPSEVLAALNHLAVCAVNSTLFEGGFPFTFTEAYSVATPSLMSAIPMVTDVIVDEALQKIMLFDPCNVTDMVNKIAWGIENSAELYLLQKQLYDNLVKRSWSKVANEYLQLFDRVCTQEALLPALKNSYNEIEQESYEI